VVGLAGEVLRPALLRVRLVQAAGDLFAEILLEGHGRPRSSTDAGVVKRGQRTSSSCLTVQSVDTSSGTTTGTTRSSKTTTIQGAPAVAPVGPRATPTGVRSRRMRWTVQSVTSGTSVWRMAGGGPAGNATTSYPCQRNVRAWSAAARSAAREVSAK